MAGLDWCHLWATARGGEAAREEEGENKELPRQLRIYLGFIFDEARFRSNDVWQETRKLFILKMILLRQVDFHHPSSHQPSAWIVCQICYSGLRWKTLFKERELVCRPTKVFRCSGCAEPLTWADSALAFCSFNLLKETSAASWSPMRQVDLKLEIGKKKGTY